VPLYSSAIIFLCYLEHFCPCHLWYES